MPEDPAEANTKATAIVHSIRTLARLSTTKSFDHKTPPVARSNAAPIHTEGPGPPHRPVDMESRVWIGTKGRYDPRQRFEEAILSFDGDTLTFRGDGMPVSLNLSEVRFDFPRSMSKAGFLMTQRGIKAYIWFYDPFAGRKTLISSGDKDEAVRDGVHSCFVGRRVAKPWLKALRARTR